VKAPHQLWRVLRSRKLAVAFIALLTLLCVVGTIVPQKGETGYDEWQLGNPRLEALVGWLGLNGVFTSPPFVTLVAAVGVATSACAVSRLGALKGAPADAGLFASLLARQRPFGSAVFHIGIIVTLAGGATSALTRFEGKIVVCEGKALALEESSFSFFGTRGALSSAYAPFGVHLGKFRPTFETPWGIPDYASDVVVVADGKAQAKATVRVNEPFVHRGVTIYQGTHGFAVRFMFAERKTRKLFNSRVIFETDLTSEPVRYVGSFDVPDTDFAVDAEFFPDAIMEDGKLRTKSPVPRNPAASVVVRRDAEVVFSGPIFRARPVEFEKGVCIGLGAPRYWSKFTVVKDSGVTLVFVGAWIAIAGLCVRFLPRTMKRREREGGA